MNERKQLNLQLTGAVGHLGRDADPNLREELGRMAGHRADDGFYFVAIMETDAGEIVKARAFGPYQSEPEACNVAERFIVMFQQEAEKAGIVGQLLRPDAFGNMGRPH